VHSGAARRGICHLSAQQFEDLVYALVRIDEPLARQLTPPDAGRDTIVAGVDGERERAWQVKHHTDGINWAKCRKSLQDAVDKRNSAEVIFVFPVNMTEGKELGLQELRADFPQLILPEPWTLGTLREELNKHPEIRRKHIDDVVGLDHEFARDMFERGARLRAGWDEQTAAAIGMSCWRGSLTTLRACGTWSDFGGAKGSPAGSAVRSTVVGRPAGCVWQGGRGQGSPGSLRSGAVA
jgi:hypothetical protein